MHYFAAACTFVGSIHNAHIAQAFCGAGHWPALLPDAIKKIAELRIVERLWRVVSARMHKAGGMHGGCAGGIGAGCVGGED